LASGVAPDAGGVAMTTRRRKTTTNLKRRKARPAVRRRASRVGGRETKVARLTRELREAQEQQTATSEVLRVISSSPGELKPVFDAMLANATRICGAEFGLFYLEDGELARIAAVYNVPPALVAAHDVPLRVHPKSGHAEIRRTKQVVHIDDIRAMPP
jgi:hypothetical protein